MDPDYHVKRIDMRASPTVARALETVLEINPDVKAFSFVQTGPQPSVAIFMLGVEGIRMLGPFLKDHLQKLGRQPEARAFFDSACTIKDFFEELHRLKLQYFWTAEENKYLLLILTGPSVTPEFCAELTRLGCPTRLT